MRHFHMTKKNKQQIKNTKNEQKWSNVCPKNNLI